MIELIAHSIWLLWCVALATPISGIPLNSGEFHRTTVDHDGTGHLLVRVQQENLDVVLKVTSPSGVETVIDSPNGRWGPELFCAARAEPGTWTLTVAAPGPQGDSGRVHLEIETLGENERMRAALAQTEASLRYQQSGPTSMEAASMLFRKAHTHWLASDPDSQEAIWTLHLIAALDSQAAIPIIMPRTNPFIRPTFISWSQTLNTSFGFTAPIDNSRILTATA